MIELNFQTADSLIIHDKKLQQLLPRFKPIFDQWTLGIRVPALGFMAQKSRLDFLNQLTDEDIRIISAHLGDEVGLEKMEYRTSKDHKVPIKRLDDVWPELSCSGDNFCISRDANQVYISLWK